MRCGWCCCWLQSVLKTAAATQPHSQNQRPRRSLLSHRALSVSVPAMARNLEWRSAGSWPRKPWPAARHSHFKLRVPLWLAAAEMRDWRWRKAAQCLSCFRRVARCPPARFSMEPKPQARATSAIEIQKPGLVSSSVSMLLMLLIWPARSMPSVSSGSRPTPSRRADDRARRARRGVHTDVYLHPKVPRVALLGLGHLEVALG